MFLSTLLVSFTFAEIGVGCISFPLNVGSRPSLVSELLFPIISSCCPRRRLLLCFLFVCWNAFVKLGLLILAFVILILHLNNCNYLALCSYNYLHIPLKILNYYFCEINVEYLNSDNLSKLNHRISNLLQSSSYLFNYLFSQGLNFCLCDDSFSYFQYFSC